jgi:peptidoglycan/xylan/chitin deacetylase (PgdA/CDA1 family)
MLKILATRTLALLRIQVRILVRIMWLMPVVLLGLLATEFQLVSQILGIGWEYGTELMFPPPVMPGPIKIKPGSKPDFTVIVTFDDIDVSMHELLYPIMQKYRLPGSQSVITGRIGGYKSRFMSWKQIDAEKAWGFDMLPHSRTHRTLTKITIDEAKNEIFGSRHDLQTHFGGEPAKVFVPPEGEVNDALLELIQEGIIQEGKIKEAGFEANLLAWGGELNPPVINDASRGIRDPYHLTRYDVKNYHSAEDVCNAVKKGEGKPQVLILVYHYGIQRPAPASKTEFKTMESIGGKVPTEYHVFQDVFEDTMACIAAERDAGRIRLSSIPEAIAFYDQRKQDADRKEAEEEAQAAVAWNTAEVPAQPVKLEVVSRPPLVPAASKATTTQSTVRKASEVRTVGLSEDSACETASIEPWLRIMRDEKCRAKTTRLASKKEPAQKVQLAKVETGGQPPKVKTQPEKPQQSIPLPRPAERSTQIIEVKLDVQTQPEKPQLVTMPLPRAAERSIRITETKEVRHRSHRKVAMYSMYKHRGQHATNVQIAHHAKAPTSKSVERQDCSAFTFETGCQVYSTLSLIFQSGDPPQKGR